MTKHSDRIVRIKELLGNTSVENSRMVAAAIGNELSEVSNDDDAPAVCAAADVVRDATFHLFRVLHSGGDMAGARRYASIAVNCLEAALPPVPPPAIPKVGSRLNLADRLKAFVADQIEPLFPIVTR